MQTITRDELQRHLERGDVKLIEVLGEPLFKKFHLPGAINVPFGDDFAEQIERFVPDRKTPLVVYCLDMDRHASPNAARTLDELGYQQVYDYEAGNMAWKEAGLPVES